MAAFCFLLFQKGDFLAVPIEGGVPSQARI